MRGAIHAPLIEKGNRMLNSKRTVLVLLALVLTVLAAASSFAPAADACVKPGVYRYYNNSLYTVQVGTKTVSCTCQVTSSGTVTSYVKFSAYNCSDPL